MNTDLKFYYKAKQFVINSFTKVGDDHGIKHFERTVYWLKKLKPDADEALLIAAFTHDIERAFRDHTNYDNINKSAKGFSGNEHLIPHQEKGAKIIADFLEQQGANRKLIERVSMLVSKHEVGGNDDQNLLKDADSISFLENNIDHFIDAKVKQTSKQMVKEKFDWMFNRITSAKAKQIAQPWYEDAVNKLNKMNSEI